MDTQYPNEMKMARTNTQVYYRIVKAGKGHPFAGLYAVEKLYIKGGAIFNKEIVKEWDLRILTEAALARFGGSQAFDEYKSDNGEPEDITEKTSQPEVAARDPKELLTSKNKLTRELKFKP
jgi:hypothetical protein